MKHLYTLVALIACSTGLIAQSSAYTAPSNHHEKVVNKLLQKQAVSAMSTRALTDRVIGQRTIDNMFVTYADSVNVSYVYNGLSTYDYNMMIYAYNYPYSTSPMFDYMGVFTKPQIEYDTFNHFTVNPATLVYGFYEQDLNTYDLNKNLTNDVTFYADSSSMPNMIYDNRFNAANNVDTCYTYNYSGGVSSPAFKQFFTYNTSNLLTKDSIYEYHLGVWHLVSKTYYLYDGFNNLVKIDQFSNTQDTTYTMPLVEQFQYLNTYDGSNRLKAVVTNFWDGAALNPYVRDTFNYTGASTFHTDWKQYQYDPINAYWAPMSYMHKSLNGLNLPDTIFVDGFDSLANMWTPSMKQVMTYNAANNPIKLDEYWFNFVSFPATPDFETTYYYETFNNTTQTGNIHDEINTFILYPNPNNGFMQLGYNLQDDGLLNLYDYTGKNIRSYKLPAGKNTFTINEPNLADGIYYYKVISNGKISAANKIVIVK